VQAEGLRAQNAGEHTKAAKLLFDAVQSFATLNLDYERAVALADLARSLPETGRRDQAQSQLDEAKAIAGSTEGRRAADRDRSGGRHRISTPTGTPRIAREA
jgi:hypothetical protein